MHGSLLPKYRGAAPIRWAIINGEAKTGVSVIRMDESVDTGDIILKSKQVPVKKEDTYATLSEKLSVLGADSLLKAVDLIESGKASFTPQEDSQATPAPKLTKKDGLIDWGLAAEAICNRVRALEPWPGTYTFLNGKMLKVLEAEPAALRTSDVRKFRTSDVRRAAKPGEVILAAGDDIQVATGSGVLEVTKLQLEGSKAMDARAFLAGHDLKEGVMLCRN